MLASSEYFAEAVKTISVTANGLSFEVAEAGSGDRLALCLHGFPEHAFSWRYQVPLLTNSGYRVWAPNLRGYGNTDSPQSVEAYRLETLVNDVVCLIKVARASEVLLLGHDWGGALAWLTAIQHPELIKRLVICNLPHPACFHRELKRPPQIFKSWYMLFFQIPILPEYLLTRDHARAIGEMFKRTTRAPARFTEKALETYKQNGLRPGGMTAMLNWYRALFRYGQPRALARQVFRVIETPTLFLWGYADAALDIRTTRGTDQYVADLTFRVFPGVSHWIQQEAPEAVNAMLGAWLANDPVPTYEQQS